MLGHDWKRGSSRCVLTRPDCEGDSINLRGVTVHSSITLVCSIPGASSCSHAQQVVNVGIHNVLSVSPGTCTFRRLSLGRSATTIGLLALEHTPQETTQLNEEITRHPADATSLLLRANRAFKVPTRNVREASSVHHTRGARRLQSLRQGDMNTVQC